ncbi:hypothetical protein MKW92_026930, partial [Papaver armeniacum]
MLRGFYDIHKFHLHWEDRQTDKILQNNYSLEMRFPHSLFNSQSLSKLVLKMTLNYESKVILPKSVDLPRLKFMSLSSCPILESLILRDIWIKDGYDTVVNIESNELKHVEIINNIGKLVCYHYNMAKIIKLSTPNLTSFICEDYMLQEYFIENVSSLVTADIKMFRERVYTAFRNHGLKISEAKKEKLYPKRMMEFIGAFQKITELAISSPGFFQV